MIQPKLNVDHSQKPKSFEAFVSSSKWNKKCKTSQFVLRHRLQELCIYKHKTTFGNNPNQFGWELTAFRCCSAYLPTWFYYIFCTGFCNTSLYRSHRTATLGRRKTASSQPSRAFWWPGKGLGTRPETVSPIITTSPSAPKYSSMGVYFVSAIFV